MYFRAYAAPIPTFSNQSFFTGPGGGIGRRKGLKIPREQSRAGSTPALGT